MTDTVTKTEVKTTGVPAPGLSKTTTVTTTVKTEKGAFRLVNRNDFKVTGRVDNVPYDVLPNKHVDFDTLAAAVRVRDRIKADGGGELSFATKEELEAEKAEVARLEAAKKAAADLEVEKQKAMAEANAKIEAARLEAEKVEADFEMKKAEAEKKVVETKEK